MAKEKITPKLHFEVGEKVVICGAEIPITGNRYYPKEQYFTFTTIKEVKEDGSVVVEEGYVYRQSYETYYGDVTLHDYFRINRVPKNDKVYSFNGKGYYYPNSIYDWFSTFLPTYLFKFDQSWQDKADKIEEADTKRQVAEKKLEEHEARKQVFRDAFEKEIEPYAIRLHNAEVKAFRKHICGNCIHNHDGYCGEWQRKIKDSQTTLCSCFDIPKEGE